MAKKEKISLVVDKILYYGIMALCFLIPLVLFRATHNQFDLPKITLLWTGAIFLLLTFLFGLFYIGEVKIKRTALDVPILVFLLLLLLSTSLSIDIATSIFGKYARFEGLVTFLSLGILYFLTVQTFQDVSRVRALVLVIILGAFVVSLYGLVQFAGYDFLEWGKLPFELRRSFSTLGNPDFLGGFLATMLPVVLALYFLTDDFFEKWIFALVIVAVFMSLLTAFCRGAWLGAFVGVAFFLFLSLKRIFKERKREFFVALGVALGVFLLVGVFTLSSPDPVLHLFERIKSAFQISEGSVGHRIEIWKAAVQMIKERPIFGFGPDTFRLAFWGRKTLEYSRMTPFTVADNAHNQFLQLAATAGILAALTFYFILVLFFIKSTKNILSGLKREAHYLAIGLTAGLLAYVIHLFFCVNVVGGGLFIWIFMGAVMALIVSKEVTLKINLSSGARMGAGGLIGILLITGWLQLMRYPLADNYYFYFKRFSNMGNFNEADRSLQKALETFPYVWIYPVGGGNFYAQHAMITQDLVFYDKAIKTFEFAEKVSPLEFDTYVLKGQTYYQMATTIDKKYFREAIIALEKAIKLHPKSFMANQLLGICYFEVGEYKLARNSLKQALKIIPDSFLAYYYLGQSNEQLGDIEEAKKMYKKALELNPNHIEASEALARL